MGLLVTVLFLTPLLASLSPLFENRSPLLRWFPPFWFLALYLDLLPGQPGGRCSTNWLPWRGMHWPSPRGFRRLLRRRVSASFPGCDGEPRKTAGEGPGTPARMEPPRESYRLLPHPLERATFHFIGIHPAEPAASPVPGDAMQEWRWPSPCRPWCGSVQCPGSPVLTFVPSGLLAIPLSLSFFSVTGLRGAFNLPAEFRANWIFQMCESEDRIRHFKAARKWIVAMGLLPLFALLAPFEIYCRGPRLAFIHITFALALSLVLLEVLLVWFRKIPFTCSYFPGKTSMAVMALLYLAGFVFYAGTMAGLESQWIDSPVQLLAFYVAMAAALCGLALLERREFGINDALIYEDEPEPIVRQLELG